MWYFALQNVSGHLIKFKRGLTFVDGDLWKVHGAKRDCREVLPRASWASEVSDFGALTLSLSTFNLKSKVCNASVEFMILRIVQALYSTWRWANWPGDMPCGLDPLPRLADRRQASKRVAKSLIALADPGLG
jgi:hypothetical protein